MDQSVNELDHPEHWWHEECRTCWYYIRRPFYDMNIDNRGLAYLLVVEGRCHRYPPPSRDDDKWERFPCRPWGDWCGEYSFVGDHAQAPVDELHRMFPCAAPDALFILWDQERVTIGDFAQMDDNDLKNIHGIGEVRLKRLQRLRVVLTCRQREEENADETTD